MLAVLVPAAAAVTGSAWPVALVVATAGVPAAVAVRRLWHVLVLVVSAVSVVSTLLLSGEVREAAPWVLVAAAGAAAVGVWGGLRHSKLAGRLADARSRYDSVSVHDDLTGCRNDAGLLLLGDHVLQGVRRSGEAMHALVVHVDGLGRVNDRLGRAAGDEVLVAVADALQAATRGTDVVARGEQGDFTVLGPGVGVPPGELERRIRAHLVEMPPVPLDVWPCRVTAGLGVLEPWDGGGVTDVLREAREDLSLRASLRAPSAPEPVHRRDAGTR